MAPSIRLRVDKSMKMALEKERKRAANKLKKEFNLNEITIHGTLASKIAASRLMNNKGLSEYRIKKTGLNRGILEFF